MMEIHMMPIVVAIIVRDLVAHDPIVVMVSEKVLNNAMMETRSIQIAVATTVPCIRLVVPVETAF